MSKRVIGIALIVLSDIALIVSLAADQLGLGTAPGILGYKQIIGAVVALVIQVVGIVLSQMPSKTQGAAGK